MQVLSQVGRRVEDARQLPGARIVGRELRTPRHLLAHVGVERAPVERGEAGAFLGVRHHHEVPALRVGAGRRLERDLDRALDQGRLDWADEAEPLADRACGGEQKVGPSDVHGGDHTAQVGSDGQLLA